VRNALMTFGLGFWFVMVLKVLPVFSNLDACVLTQE